MCAHDLHPVLRRLAGALADAVSRPAGAPIAGRSLHGFVCFAIKIVFWFFMIAMVKAIVPRYRYDQLMRLGWKIFLPTSLVAVVLVAAWRVFGPAHDAGSRAVSLVAPALLGLAACETGGANDRPATADYDCLQPRHRRDCDGQGRHAGPQATSGYAADTSHDLRLQGEVT